MSSDSDLPALDLAVGLALTAAAAAVGAARLTGRMLRPVVNFAIHPPLVPEQLSPHTTLGTLAEQGRLARLQAEQVARRLVDEVVPSVVNTVVGQVDLNAVLAKVDFEAVLARLDIAGLASQVIDEIDLPDIIRESSGAMASEAVIGMRIQGIEADERVNRVIDRILLRRRNHDPAGQ